MLIVATGFTLTTIGNGLPGQFWGVFGITVKLAIEEVVFKLVRTGANVAWLVCALMPVPDKEFAGVTCGAVQEKVTPVGKFGSVAKVGGVPLQTTSVSL